MKKDSKTLKTILILVVVVALLVGGYFGYRALTNKEEKPVENKITPLLYEVTKEGSDNKMYLFGSIHLANKADLSFPEYVINAYKNSHYLACEFDLVEYSKNLEKAMNDAYKMLYDDGTTVKQHLNEETYNKMVNLLTEKKLYSGLYDNYKTYFFVSLLTNAMGIDAKIDPNNGIDMYFLNKAKSENKTILEVESSDFQNDLFLSFPDEFYELMIAETIENYDDNVEGLKKLYEAWKTGNIADLEKYGSEDLEVDDTYTDQQKAYIEDYNNKIVTERNKTMTDKAIEYFNNNQDVFFMVGTLHIIGEDGIAKQLEKQGFTVRQVN